MTVVSNNVHQLRHLHFSIEQILDLSTEYHFNPSESVKDLLEFYMGKNTPERQDFIVENLKVDVVQ